MEVLLIKLALASDEYWAHDFGVAAAMREQFNTITAYNNLPRLYAEYFS